MLNLIVIDYGDVIFNDSLSGECLAVIFGQRFFWSPSELAKAPPENAVMVLTPAPIVLRTVRRSSLSVFEVSIWLSFSVMID